MKRVDDNKLLEMLDQGIPQKQIAKHFGVVESYITKRKKQLRATEVVEPMSFSKLTNQQKKFVISKAEGKTNVQSVLDSYEVTSQESAKSLGTTLMKNPAIAASIEELMVSVGLSKEDRIRQLKKLVYSRDGNVSLKALDQTWRLDGSYQPERHVVEVDIEAIMNRAEQLYQFILINESKRPEPEQIIEIKPITEKSQNETY